MPSAMTAESPLQAPGKMETAVAEIGWNSLESLSSGDDLSGFGSFSDFLTLSNGDAPVQVDHAVENRVEESAAVELDAIGEKLGLLSFGSAELSNDVAVARDPVAEAQQNHQPQLVNDSQESQRQQYQPVQVVNEAQHQNHYQVELQQSSYYQAPVNEYPGWRYNYQTGQWEAVNDHQVNHHQVNQVKVPEVESVPAVKEVELKQKSVQQNQNSFQDSFPGWAYNYQTGQWEKKDSAVAQSVEVAREENQVGVPQNTNTNTNTQSWESSYPGWTFNYQTGQWEEKSSPSQYQFGQQVQYVVQPPRTQQEALRSTAGRPSHTVTAFGFGGRLVIMKPKDPFLALEQDSGSPAFQLLHLNQFTDCGLGYGSISGPLAGNASTKDVLKWVDEKISKCLEDPALRSLRYLWGVLKIFSQNYGNLRSSAAGQDNNGPEAALAKLLDSNKNQEFHGFDCGGLLPLPSEQQIRATAFEVKRLLILGKQQEALRAAQEGQLWGSALVLAQKLGEKFYADTVALMAQRQFQPGFPLRTLSLLYAGQHTGVFVGANSANVLPSPQGAPGSSGDIATEDAVKGMLAEWEENLAIMAANPTNGDERVIMCLGDCLWNYQNEVFGAHLCYLVANAMFEPFASTSRLCLIGADHVKYPRTYASPEAIQRTEVYEFAKVTGNSQFSLLPFQPYKFIYASLLAEAGKVNEALRYCQAVQKALRTAGHAADELSRQAAALEERLRVHSQGGQGSSLVHRLFGNIGGLIPGKARDSPDNMNRPVTNASRSSSFLVPSTSSMEPISDISTRVPVRSVSEPDFRPVRNISEPELKPAQTVDSPGSGSKAPNRNNVISSFVQRAMGLIRTPSKEAKLGEANKFRYDEKLKRWVEEGAEITEEPTFAPPPKAKFTAPREDENPAAFTPERPVMSGIPPMPPSSNHYSARARQNVRSRYVDVFNKGGPTPPKPSESLFLPPAKTGSLPPAKFFVPAASEVNVAAGGSSLEERSRNGPVAFDPPPPLVQQQELMIPHNSNGVAAMEAPGPSSVGAFYSNHQPLPVVPTLEVAQPPPAAMVGVVESGQGEAALIHTSDKSAFGDDMQDVEL